jgi:parallel beta-helix repeat protein
MSEERLLGGNENSGIECNIDFTSVENEICAISNEMFIDSCYCEVELEQLLINGDNSWEVCVKVQECGDGPTWRVFEYPSASQTNYSGYSICHTVSSGNVSAQFTHTKSINEIELNCDLFVQIDTTYECNDTCVFEIDRKACDYEIRLQPCEDLDILGTPFWIDYGDGTVVKAETFPLYHEYKYDGEYEICITFISDTTIFGEILYSSCCQLYSFDNSDCCPSEIITEDLVQFVSQECDSVCLEFKYPGILDTGKVVITWNGGNEFGEYESDTTLCNELEEGDVEICVRFYYLDTLRTCCYTFEISHDCCESADFSFMEADSSPSCANPRFLIVPDCAKEGPNKHRWIFEDGREFNTPYPPSPYMFTDFINTDDSVCVTHEVICCGDTLRAKRCKVFRNHAILGRPDESRRLTDVLPIGITVESFIDTYSDNPLVPLIIEGDLIIDRSRNWTDGSWYMANFSRILVETTLFGLNNVNIVSAGRAAQNNYACCRWYGVESTGRTRLPWSGIVLKDAFFALHYPQFQTSTPCWLAFEDNLLSNNIFGIKSSNQSLYVAKFENNTINGADHNDLLCDCMAINGIDIRNVSNTSVFRLPQQRNKIQYYEKGFNVQNSSLEARGFDIKYLDNYDEFPWQPVLPFFNADEDTEIGIDYEYNGFGSSSRLEFDEFYFEDMRIGVRDKSYSRYSTHTLSAVANQPLVSIQMSELDQAYEIDISSPFNGQIIDNDLEPEGKGIEGFIGSSRNQAFVLVHGNRIINDGNNTNEANGIAFQGLGRFASWPQSISIRENYISNVSSVDGHAIRIGNLAGTQIWHNTIELSSPNTDGIVLSMARESVVNCNTIHDNNFGLRLEVSGGSQIRTNDILDNKLSMELLGNNSWPEFLDISWNKFRYSTNESNYYALDAISGPQEHTRYNEWTTQGTDEVYHEDNNTGNQGDPFNCRFWYPQAANVGSINYPTHNNTALFEATDEAAEIDSNFCGDVLPASLPVLEYPESTWPSDSIMAILLDDTSALALYSEAQRFSFDLLLFQQLSENSGSLDSSQILSDFYNDHDTGYVGELIKMQDSLNNIYESFTTGIQSLSDYHQELDSLEQVIDLLVNEVDNSLDSLEQDSLLIVIGEKLQEKDSIQSLLDVEAQVLDSTGTAHLNDLILLIQALPDTNAIQEANMDLAEIVVTYILNDTLSSSDSVRVRDIASSCYVDIGLAVLEARGLAWVLLGEHYEEDYCIQAIGTNSSKFESTESAELGFVLHPNPASNQVQVSLNHELLSKNDPITLRVHTLKGNEVFSKELLAATKTTNIYLEGLKSGVYLVSVYTVDGKRFTDKLIVQ